MEHYFKALELGIFEYGEAFHGLEDEHVWQRPHPNLLSIGEITAHVGYALATSFLSDDFETPLRNRSARYPLVTLEEPIVLDLGAQELIDELRRLVTASIEALRANPPALEAAHPTREGWTWGILIEYQIFHLAYHTGQIFTTRHLMGHETTDN